MKEMLEEIREHFELILFSNQSRLFTTKIAESLNTGEGQLFSHVLCKDECIYQ